MVEAVLSTTRCDRALHVGLSGIPRVEVGALRTLAKERVVVERLHLLEGKQVAALLPKDKTDRVERNMRGTVEGGTGDLSVSALHLGEDVAAHAVLADLGEL